MPKTRTRVYRVATETPSGFFWHCIWCHQESTERYSTWGAAVDALMDVHAPGCALHKRWLVQELMLEDIGRDTTRGIQLQERWLALNLVLERRETRRRNKGLVGRLRERKEKMSAP